MSLSTHACPPQKRSMELCIARCEHKVDNCTVVRVRLGLRMYLREQEQECTCESESENAPARMRVSESENVPARIRVRAWTRMYLQKWGWEQECTTENESKSVNMHVDSYLANKHCMSELWQTVYDAISSAMHSKCMRVYYHGCSPPA